ncbi:hypothetical protein LCGC14_2763220 [marine sediment metagenome]|uniref:Uncharacterized protein n=1 Tax=marine sediment metagenome TaxID=412755 RepID=A0A0F8YYF6_9ZZZZ
MTLTKRQLFVVEEVLTGRPVKQVAEGLGVSVRQVYYLLERAREDDRLETYFTLRDAAQRELKKVKQSKRWPYERGAQERAALWLLKRFCDHEELSELGVL